MSNPNYRRGIWCRVCNRKGFNGPDVVSPRDRYGVAFGAVESPSVIVLVDVEVSKSWRRQDSSIQSDLAGHPLRLLLRRHG